MSAEKTNKSVAKRVKVTKKGKLLTNKLGRNHYNAKASGASKIKKKGKKQIKLTTKQINRALPHS